MSYEEPETSEPVAVLTIVGMAVAIGLSLLLGAQLAVLLMASACYLGAAARIALPVKRAFAVRRRAIDVAILLVFGGGLTFLGFTAPL